MKKLLGLAILVMSFALAACSSNDNNSSETDRDHNTSDNSNRAQEEPTEDSLSDIRIKLSFNKEEVLVRMYDNPASRDFLDQLPLTVTFEDYVGKEKISILQKKLAADNIQSENQPKKGDFAYFSPWGNLAIFYKGIEDATNDLVILGQIESGKEKFENIQSDFTVSIEKVD
ncbi:cyclophilin-like fold protein [Peribacillus simplex]|uniref:cyclophilin-like fold protein n=1 Tax=Peribacillus simplex TaxID=1478 RepID=UPI0024C0B00A|nr:cyclophilin-like fold protein [Peribacillus simplex]WHY95392.1 cyclophilin-like fold protein [Peribacillus simplex]